MITNLHFISNSTAMTGNTRLYGSIRLTRLSPVSKKLRISMCSSSVTKTKTILVPQSMFKLQDRRGNSNMFSFLNSTFPKETRMKHNTGTSYKRVLCNQLPGTKHSVHSRQLNKFSTLGSSTLQQTILP
jgi:hypothetical protein